MLDTQEEDFRTVRPLPMTFSVQGTLIETITTSPTTKKPSSFPLNNLYLVKKLSSLFLLMYGIGTDFIFLFLHNYKSGNKSVLSSVQIFFYFFIYCQSLSKKLKETAYYRFQNARPRKTFAFCNVIILIRVTLARLSMQKMFLSQHSSATGYDNIY